VSASADTLVDINLGARADGCPEPAASEAAEPVVAGV
jgi:hypothetical protein